MKFADKHKLSPDKSEILVEAWGNGGISRDGGS